MANPNQCKACKWYLPRFVGDELAGDGECRRFPPAYKAAIQTSNRPALASLAADAVKWPPVNDDDYCGEYAAQATQVY